MNETRYVVRKTKGKRGQWDVIDTTDGYVIEGGFFDKSAAEFSADDLNRSA
jgi:hypothetical protein